VIVDRSFSEVTSSWKRHADLSETLQKYREKQDSCTDFLDFLDIEVFE